MSAWSNIGISPNDPEIIAIDKLEKKLGELPSSVQQIRELITRFEVCHFKYQDHIRNIIGSIFNLKPYTNPEQIGAHHIRSGENAMDKDTSGRSPSGYKYVGALNNWLGNDPKAESRNTGKKFDQQITKWLGEKNPDKERLVRLLIARLTWDWESYEKLHHKEESNELELQVCSMDVCHYNFPKNLDLVLKGIGELKPVKVFEGCGSFTPDIKIFVEKEFLILNDLLRSKNSVDQPDKDELVKAWLIACMAKTLKEQVALKEPIQGIVNQ